MIFRSNALPRNHGRRGPWKGDTLDRKGLSEGFRSNAFDTLDREGLMDKLMKKFKGEKI
jgi:hypothetical protein